MIKTAEQWAKSAKIYGDKAVSVIGVTIAYYHAKDLAVPKDLVLSLDLETKRYWKIKLPKKQVISRMRQVASNLIKQGMSNVYMK